MDALYVQKKDKAEPDIIEDIDDVKERDNKLELYRNFKKVGSIDLKDVKEWWLIKGYSKKK